MDRVLANEPHLTTVGGQVPKEDSIPLSSASLSGSILFPPFHQTARQHPYSRHQPGLERATGAEDPDTTALRIWSLVRETSRYHTEGQYIGLWGSCFSPLRWVTQAYNPTGMCLWSLIQCQWHFPQRAKLMKFLEKLMSFSGQLECKLYLTCKRTLLNIIAISIPKSILILYISNKQPEN